MDVNYEVVSVNEIDDIPSEGAQLDLQPFDVGSTSSAPTPSQSAPPYPSSSRSASVGFVVIS